MPTRTRAAYGLSIFQVMLPFLILGAAILVGLALTAIH